MRSLIAIFAILLNAALPAGWQVASADDGPLGGTHSICLASGGVIHEIPQPDTSPAAPADPLHCHLCLLPGPAAAATPQPAVTVVSHAGLGRIRYEPAGTMLVPSRVGDAFDARAPPVRPASR